MLVAEWPMLVVGSKEVRVLLGVHHHLVMLLVFVLLQLSG